MADILIKAWLTSNLARTMFISISRGNLLEAGRIGIFGARLAWHRATGRPIPRDLRKYGRREAVTVELAENGQTSDQAVVAMAEVEALIRRDPISASLLIGKVKGGKAKRTLYGSLAREFYDRWDLPRALRANQRVLARNPSDPAALRLQAELMVLVGRKEEARDIAQAAFNASPLDVRSYQLLAKFEPKHVLDSHLDRVTALVEGYGWTRAAAISAIRVLFDFSRVEQGLALLERYRAFTSDPSYDEAEVTLFQGTGFVFERRFREAVPHLDRIKDHPRFGKTARSHLAECYFELGDPEATIEVYSGAYPENERPRAFNLFYFLANAAKPDMRTAWEEYRVRGFSYAMRKYLAKNYRQHLSEMPEGGSVFMLAEGGPGDELRFASLYPELSARLKNLTITCEPRLWSLLQRSFPAVRFVPTSRWRKEMIPADPKTRVGLPSAKLALTMSTEAFVIAKASDAVCSVCDLVADLRPTRSSFNPPASAYLLPHPELVDLWREYIDRNGVKGRPNVAISWRSLLRHIRRDMHYLSADDLRPLERVDAVYWLFQPMVEDDEISTLRTFLPNVRVVDGLDLRDDFEGMAAFLSLMDGVVAPCNTTAELSGAVGAPTVFFGRTEGAKWRVTDDGQDIWHHSVQSVLGSPIGDRDSTAEAIASQLRVMIG